MRSSAKDKRDKAELIQWYKVMDTLFGRNKAKQNVCQALWMASECEHEDAKWLVTLFRDGAPATTDEARRVFLEQSEDARAMFFAACVCWRRNELMEDIELVQRAAQLGYAPAQARVSEWKLGSERFSWAEKAAAQGDRDGLCCFANCLWNAVGCAVDKSRALVLYKEAAELENLYGCWWYAERAFTEDDWERFHWWGRAATLGEEASRQSLVNLAVEQLQRFMDGESGRIMFEIGAACKEHVDKEHNTVFSRKFRKKNVRAVERAIALHDKWCTNAKRTIYCWIWVGKKLGLSKDVRFLISNEVWRDRAAWSERRQCGGVSRQKCVCI
jgi:hypothetical protein